MNLLRVAAFALLTALAGCGEPEGPAANVFLQIVRGDPALDTTGVTGFVVVVGGARNPVAYVVDERIEIPLVAPPGPAVPIVVYACTTRTAACREVDAAFIGCTVQDLVAGDSAVVVGLLPISPLPETCVGIDGAPPAPAG